MNEIKLILFWEKGGHRGNMFIYGRGIADIRRQSMKELDLLHVDNGVLLYPGKLTSHSTLARYKEQWYCITQSSHWPGFRIGKDGKRL